MSSNISIRRAVRCALLASAAVAAVSPAQAQDPNPSIQEVVVTGSRIAQPNLTSISPVTSIAAEDVKLQGVTRIEDLINNLPQAFADLGGNLSNGATGTASVNLRNLGRQRTLVLVNNRRLMPGDPTQNAAASPDLNQIPAALIERVEVLTGGASAVYGADAVAGVVNFIMNDKFEGVRVDAQYSLYQHNSHSDIADLVRARNFELPDSNIMDGQTKDLTFIAGINTPDGRGNATVYLGYRTLSEIRQDARDFSACALALPNNALPNPFSCGGSGTSGVSRFIVGSGNPVNGPGNGDFALDASGALRAWAATDQFNFAPDNYYQRPDERKTAGLFAHYDFSEKASVYTEFMFMDDRTLAQVAASGAFLGAGPGQPPFFGDQAINCDNAFLSAAMVTQFCGGDRGAGDALVTVGRRNVEGGGRLDDLRHTSFRGVVGLRGDITDRWSYDVYGLYGTSILAENSAVAQQGAHDVADAARSGCRADVALHRHSRARRDEFQPGAARHGVLQGSEDGLAQLLRRDSVVQRQRPGDVQQRDGAARHQQRARQGSAGDQPEQLPGRALQRQHLPAGVRHARPLRVHGHDSRLLRSL
ncbi:MAG: TonB-dependent receptor plug domain-containing protein [Steroidobacteraceae bacterium]